MTKNKKLALSQKAHYRLMKKYQSKGNSAINRAFGNYHAECIDRQNQGGKILSKQQKKELFNWWWRDEVENNF